MSSDAPRSSDLAVALRDVRFRHPETRGTRPFELHVDGFELARGEAVACIGPSGSGKTTLVHLAAGILVPSGGAVELAGARIDALPDAERRKRRARDVGLVFQEFELLDYLNALDNVLLPVRVGGDGARWSDAVAHAERTMESLGIADLAKRRPAQLSQGERQRVAIARALGRSPSLVLCDEPTGNLDPRTANTVLDLLLDQARSGGAGLLMVTHDHSLLERFDRVIDVRELGGSAE